LTNDLLDVGYSFIPEKNQQLVACLSNPIFFEGPYINDYCKIKTGDYVLDLGANLGLFSLFASRVVGSNGQIFAFEPNKTASNFLAKNLQLNNLENVKIFNDAVGDKKEEVFFNFDQEDTYGSSHIDNNLENGFSQKVQQIKIDDFVVEQKLE